MENFYEIVEEYFNVLQFLQIGCFDVLKYDQESNGKTEEQVAAIAKLAPLERIGTPDEIAGVVAMLAGPDGGWVNSQVIRVNGGFA